MDENEFTVAGLFEELKADDSLDPDYELRDEVIDALFYSLTF